jgi:hypothetical protein
VTGVADRDVDWPELLNGGPLGARGEIAAQGEALAAGELGHASDVMMARPLALQLRNLQTLIEIAVDKNSTVVFPAPLMSTIGELGTFLNRESGAASGLPVAPAGPALTNRAVVNT